MKKLLLIATLVLSSCTVLEMTDDLVTGGKIQEHEKYINKQMNDCLKLKKTTVQECKEINKKIRPLPISKIRQITICANHRLGGYTKHNFDYCYKELVK